MTSLAEIWISKASCAKGVMSRHVRERWYADDVARGKPEPDVFLEAARRMGVPAAECVVLEDSDEGLRAAKAAGMRAVDVRTGAVAQGL